MSATPTGSPGRSGGAAAAPLLCASLGASADEPAITGTNPWSRNAAATGSITAESNPPSVSGVAIGRSSVPMPAFDRAVAEDLHVVRAVGERTHPAERLTKRRGQALGRQRHLQLDARGLAPRTGKRRRLGHFIDRRNARDRFLGELTERVRDRADEPAIDVDRAAAHAGDDAGIGERAAFEPRQDQVAARADDVAEHAEDVDLELVEPVALEDRPADADHPGLELVHGKGPALGREAGRHETAQAPRQRRKS